MATDLGELVYTLTLNDSGFQGQLDDAKDKVTETSDTVTEKLDDTAESADKAGGAFGGMAGQFVEGAALFTVGQKVLDTVKDAISDAIQSQKDWQTAEAQTAAGLKSTNDAVGLSASAIEDLAEKTQDSTGISREAVLTGENMLLTFTGIGKTVFPQATQAVADMATRMNGGAVPTMQQMNDTALQLGKALNDPTKGLTMLQREGVTFDAQETANIKTMMAHNDVAGAQAVMLNELSKEFGGSATAAAKTYQGQIDELKNRFNDLVGEGISKAEHALEDIGIYLVQHKAVLEAVAGAVAGLIVLIGVALVSALWAMVAAAFAAEGALSPIMLLALPIGAVAMLIITHWQTLKDWFNSFVTWVKGIAADIGEFFKMLGQFFTGEEIGQGLYNNMSRPFIDILQFLIKTRNNIEQWAHDFIQDIKDVAEAVGIAMLAVAAVIFWPVTVGLIMWHFFHDQIVAIFDAVVGFLKDVVIVIAAILLLPLVPIVLAWREWHDQIIAIIQAVVGGIETIFSVVVGFFASVINGIRIVFDDIVGFIVGIFLREWNGVVIIWNAVSAFFNAVVGYIKQPFDDVVGFITGVFRDAWNGITSVFSAVNNFVYTYIKMPILDAIKDAASWLYDAGKNIISGLVKGITDAIGDVTSAIGKVGSAAVTAAKSVLKIFSPSQVFSDIGTNVTLGMAQGITGATSTATDATKQMATSVINAGSSIPGAISNQTNSMTSGNNYNFAGANFNFSSAEAVDEFFSIGNRNTQLQANGIAPLAGTTGV